MKSSLVRRFSGESIARSAAPFALAIAIVTGHAAAQVVTTRALVTTPDPAAIAWDPRSQRVLIVGPTDGAKQDAWEWDGTGVTQRLPFLGAEQLGQLFGDPVGQQLLANDFNGRIGTWRGGSWQWLSRPGAPFGILPSAFDEHRRRLVVLSAYAAHSEWDGAQWTQVTPPVTPVSRSYPAFAYDPSTQRTVLHGGLSTAPLTDTWAWDGTAWTQLTANAPTGPRVDAAFAFDPAGNRMILFGGSTTDTDTWQLVGATWSQVVTAHSPDPRARATAATRLFPRLTYDGQGLLLTGGTLDRAAVVWRFAGNDWTAVGSFGVPVRGAAGLAPFAIARDVARQQWVGFGGESQSALVGNATVLFDTQWRAVPTTITPGLRNGAMLAWDAVDNGVLLWGGFDPQTVWRRDTWLWNGATWAAIPTATQPTPRDRMLLVRDPHFGVSLLSGSLVLGQPTPLDDHWQWDGIDWRLLPPGAPGARPTQMVTNAAYDEQLHRLFYATSDGIDLSLWEWDGAAWTAHANTMARATSGGLLYVPGAGVVTTSSAGYVRWNGFTWVSYLGMPSLGGTFEVDPTGQRLLARNGTAVSVVTSQPLALAATGTGCGVGDVPALGALREPTLGNARFALDVGTIAANAPTLLAIGFASGNTALGGGCTLWLDQVGATVFGLASSGARFVQPLPVPTLRALAGLEVFAQAGVLDPLHSPIGGLTTTNALRIRIGD